jgi:type I restriction enzyme S subunit
MASSGRAETRTGGRAATTGVILGDVALSVGKPSSPLPEGWAWTQLTDVARLETGHTPSRRHPEYWGGDVPWIGIKDATANHGRTLHRTNQYTNQLGIANSSARVLPTNTVCLSRTASVGFVVVMGRPMATSQDFVNWVCSDSLDFRYLKYVLLAEQESFLRFASGTTHQTIYFPEVKAFHAALPPITEQRRIADTLSSLDDRIDLLRESSTTIEAITQALFKSWFIDFEPTRAKMEGREPEGMDPITASLFSGEFEESELGPIPKEWHVRSVGDVATITRGRSYKSSELAESDTALVTLKSFNRGGGFRRDGFKPYTGPFKPDQELFEGDCIVSHTDVTQQAELIGRSAQVTGSPLYSRLVASLDIGIVRPKSSDMTSIFLSALLSGDRYLSHIKGYTSGTTVLHLSKDGLPGFRFACPPPSLVDAFSRLALTLFRRHAMNIAAQEKLMELRDTLLPRLISGKLRLPEVDPMLEEAAA